MRTQPFSRICCCSTLPSGSHPFAYRSLSLLFAAVPKEYIYMYPTSAGIASSPVVRTTKMAHNLPVFRPRPSLPFYRSTIRTTSTRKKLSVHKITISAKKSVQTSGICVSHMPGLVSATEDIVSFITLISVDNDLNKKEKKDNANLLWKYLGQKRGIAYDECGICKTRCPFIDTAENCRYMADYYIDCYFFFCLFFSLWFTVLGNSSLLQRRNLASTSRVKRLNRLFFPLKREAVENITRKGERQTENLGCVLPVNSRRAARGGFYGRIN